ncbi:hypothetical protein CROQUDRAFT_54277, partial [Cronartium quercuum f. sp. fusiforme G11]
PPLASPNPTHIKPSTPTSSHRFNILHLNCHSSKTVTHQVLTHIEYNILGLQDPWTNPHSLTMPSHTAWNIFIAFNYHPTPYANHHLNCMS